MMSKEANEIFIVYLQQNKKKAKANISTEVFSVDG
jgi:hypothetical protein